MDVGKLDNLVRNIWRTPSRRAALVTGFGALLLWQEPGRVSAKRNGNGNGNGIGNGRNRKGRRGKRAPPPTSIPIRSSNVSAG